MSIFGNKKAGAKEEYNLIVAATKLGIEPYMGDTKDELIARILLKLAENGDPS
jgi:hypothetical protein